jgi:hypothetical protein
VFGPAVRAWRAAVVLGLALAGCASATPDTDSILALFGEAAYRAGRPVVTKFAMTDLTITVAGERGPQYDAVRARLEVRLSRLSDLTGLVFIAPKEGDDPDVLVLLEDAIYVNFTKRFLCSVTYQIEDHAVVGMVVRIGTRPAIAEPQTVEERIGRCIDHELMHGIGFINHPFVSYLPTVLATHQSLQQRALAWTVNDEILMRALYDPRLTAGMSRDEATPVLRQIIPELIDDL